MPSFYIIATSHQALFSIMKLLSFILAFLSLMQVAFPHSGRTVSKWGPPGSEGWNVALSQSGNHARTLCPQIS